MAHATRESAPDSTASWEGRVIDDRYRIVRALSEGAMGQVFVAEHLTLRKEVALKVVRPELSQNSEIASRFAREALAGSRIDHPSVVAALDYGSLSEGGEYLVMRLARGERLGDYLTRRGRLPWREAVALGTQLAEALGAAWAEGFVHRDLKPDNVIVDEREGEAPLAQVLDFGVAGLAPSRPSQAEPSAPAAQPLTKEGTIIGTPGYMAPEQALGQPATHSADLYSLGVLLWEALVGERLWPGDSAQAIMRAQLTLKRPSPRQATGDDSIPADLDRLVQRLISVRPEHRPQNASQVCETLRSLDPAAEGPASAQVARASPPARRSRTLPVLGLLAAFAISGLLAFAWFGGLR